ncbi:MAG: methyltransferase domain-containing protein [Bacteroidetes bacterium]|nr:methyltransferase domain-containing protein [Bacteroidota bacterium]
MTARAGLTRWSRLRSYGQDVLVEAHPPLWQASGALPPLELYLRRNRLMLVSPGAIYSMEERYRSFAGAFERIPRGFRPGRALILGFGLGSIALILQRLLGLRPALTGVDIDPRVVSMAQRYLPEALLTRTELICTDALSWVPICPNRYELIAVDLFVDTEVPRGCANPAFLTALRRLLTPKGLLFFSRLEHEPPGSRKEFEQAAATALPGIDSFRVGGNMLYLWQE